MIKENSDNILVPKNVEDDIVSQAREKIEDRIGRIKFYCPNND